MGGCPLSILRPQIRVTQGSSTKGDWLTGSSSSQGLALRAPSLEPSGMFVGSAASGLRGGVRDPAPRPALSCWEGVNQTGRTLGGLPACLKHITANSYDSLSKSCRPHSTNEETDAKGVSTSRLPSWPPDVAEPGSEAASVGGIQTAGWGLGLGVGAPLQHQAPGPGRRCRRPWLAGCSQRGQEWAVFEAAQSAHSWKGLSPYRPACSSLPFCFLISSPQ